ncbi:response regulator transcription factor [Thiocystis violacea]|uniref:response regulator transcription factor n=1 Tax=Thiocystis violacea TaxID=13725 RepID=UPI00237BAB57|nr:response regulator [Thiocystis violacea]
MPSAADQSAKASAARIAIVAASPWVLVIEDDDSMRPAMERLLVAAGFAVTLYPSAEALLADASNPDAACIVTDLRLPGMSGLDLLAALRGRGDTTPVILITAHDAPGLGDASLRQGAANYLAKPFLGSALLGAIRAAMEST